MATHLYAVCQAIDLRVIEIRFRDGLDDLLGRTLSQHLGTFLDPKEISSLSSAMKDLICRRLEQTSSMDTARRFEDACAFVTSVALDALSPSPTCHSRPHVSLTHWRKDASCQLTVLYRKIRDDFFADSESGADYLGDGTKRLYLFVRDTLGVRARKGDVARGAPEATIGRSVAMIHEAIRSGRLYGPLLECISV
jgi:phenylalanine ammonia-lyase